MSDDGQPAEPEKPTSESASAGTVDDTEERLARLENDWRRALADLDNSRKQAARDIERERSAERARVAQELLPLVDNLDRALTHGSSGDSNADAVLEGVRAVRDQALALLARLGYPRHDDLGARFDPGQHEAVSTMQAADSPEGTVVAVVRPRYGEGEQMLRPAGVVVSTRPE